MKNKTKFYEAVERHCKTESEERDAIAILLWTAHRQAVHVGGDNLVSAINGALRIRFSQLEPSKT